MTRKGGDVVNFNQIEYFLAIVHTGGFSAATDEVFISQSSLSKQIKSLEDELGMELFTRKHAKVSLTAAGKDFLTFAEKITREHSELLSRISQYQFARQATIRVGSIPIVAAYKIATLLARFQSEQHKINIELYEEEQQSILTLLQNNQIDFAIVRTDKLDKDKYDFVPLFQDEIAAVCCIGHPLSKQKTVTLQDLKAEKIILLDPKSSLYSLCIDECSKQGLFLKIAFTTSRHQVLLEMVSANLGIALLPIKLVDTKQYHQLKVVTLANKLFSSVSLIRPKNIRPNSTTSKFWDFVIHYKTCLNSSN